MLWQCSVKTGGRSVAEVKGGSSKEEAEARAAFQAIEQLEREDEGRGERKKRRLDEGSHALALMRCSHATKIK